MGESDRKFIFTLTIVCRINGTPPTEAALLHRLVDDVQASIPSNIGRADKDGFSASVSSTKLELH